MSLTQALLVLLAYSLLEGPLGEERTRNAYDCGYLEPLKSSS